MYEKNSKFMNLLTTLHVQLPKIVVQFLYD